MLMFKNNAIRIHGSALSDQWDRLGALPEQGITQITQFLKKTTRILDKAWNVFERKNYDIFLVSVPDTHPYTDNDQLAVHLQKLLGGKFKKGPILVKHGKYIQAYTYPGLRADAYYPFFRADWAIDHRGLNLDLSFPAINTFSCLTESEISPALYKELSEIHHQVGGFRRFINDIAAGLLTLLELPLYVAGWVALAIVAVPYMVGIYPVQKIIKGIASLVTFISNQITDRENIKIIKKFQKDLDAYLLTGNESSLDSLEKNHEKLITLEEKGVQFCTRGWCNKDNTANTLSEILDRALKLYFHDIRHDVKAGQSPFEHFFNAPFDKINEIFELFQPATTKCSAKKEFHELLETPCLGRPLQNNTLEKQVFTSYFALYTEPHHYSFQEIQCMFENMWSFSKKYNIPEKDSVKFIEKFLTELFLTYTCGNVNWFLSNINSIGDIKLKNHLLLVACQIISSDPFDKELRIEEFKNSVGNDLDSPDPGGSTRLPSTYEYQAYHRPNLEAFRQQIREQYSEYFPSLSTVNSSETTAGLIFKQNSGSASPTDAQLADRPQAGLGEKKTSINSLKNP